MYERLNPNGRPIAFPFATIAATLNGNLNSILATPTDTLNYSNGSDNSEVEFLSARRITRRTAAASPVLRTVTNAAGEKICTNTRFVVVGFFVAVNTNNTKVRVEILAKLIEPVGNSLPVIVFKAYGAPEHLDELGILSLPL